MISMSLKIVFLLLVALVSLAIPSFAANNTVTVNVTVAQVTEITVVPESLNWTGLNPGSVGTAQYIDVKNSGSTSVTNIYIYASTLDDETVRPYGSSDPSKYSAAGLIVIKNETDTVPQFVGRVEWNWTDSISGATFNGINSPKAWGFYKNTSFEYVWVVGNGTGGFCNNTGAQFGISDYPDAGTTATRTTSTPIAISGGDQNFGYFSVSGKAAFGNDNVCVAVAADCTKIYIYKYDKRPGFDKCGNSQYLTTRQLAPGDILRLNYLNAYVPKGIPAGNLKQGTLTIVAS
ncbi:MAG: hypothetical protein ACP5JK_00710 [Candidatus Aenigmatarchaeota archaeon]